MQIYRVLTLLIVCTLFVNACNYQGADDQKTDKPPNIVYIMADDLGYADIGVFGGEIPTPNLDQLAKQGMILTDFHTSLSCSPTRSMLMSGTDNHIAGLGSMGRVDDENGNPYPGYEGQLNFRVATMAELLDDAGYNTYMTGKWHLGNSETTSPKARGFKRSFTSYMGSAHLGSLAILGGPDRMRSSFRHSEDDIDEVVKVGEDFYTTRVYTERMIEFIEKDRSENKPFFAWLAYTAPHWPLQAPGESIAKFKGRYDDGYEALYKKRFERMQKLGLVAKGASMFDDDIWQKRWNDLTEEEKKISAKKMEIYAAMVSDLDSYVGRFLDYLKEIGEYDNTLIVFSSDNGPESSSGLFNTWIERCCDNSYENMGSGTSYILYGRDWATASNVALRRHKASTFEGGMRVPAFVWYPGKIKGGQVSDEFATVMDILPTFLELAGTEHPGTHYKGREVEPLRGQSLLPLLFGSSRSFEQPGYTGWELYGHKGIRAGDWKIVWDARQGDEAQWQLFNMAEDLSEQDDLSDSNPEKLAEMIAMWEHYSSDVGVVARSVRIPPGPPAQGNSGSSTNQD